MRQRLAAGEQVARMYQQPGPAWLERQAEAAEQLLAERRPTTRTVRSCRAIQSRLPRPRILALSAHDPAEVRESLELSPSWVLAQKAAANRQLIAVMHQRLAAGQQVAQMYQEPGLAWLEHQAEAGEQLLAERQAGGQS